VIDAAKGRWGYLNRGRGGVSVSCVTACLRRHRVGDLGHSAGFYQAGAQTTKRHRSVSDGTDPGARGGHRNGGKGQERARPGSG
jgi:hypothetical protein